MQPAQNPVGQYPMIRQLAWDYVYPTTRPGLYGYTMLVGGDVSELDALRRQGIHVDHVAPCSGGSLVILIGPIQGLCEIAMRTSPFDYFQRNQHISMPVSASTAPYAQLRLDRLVEFGFTEVYDLDSPEWKKESFAAMTQVRQPHLYIGKNLSPSKHISKLTTTYGLEILVSGAPENQNLEQMASDYGLMSGAQSSCRELPRKLGTVFRFTSTHAERVLAAMELSIYGGARPIFYNDPQTWAQMIREVESK